ncbi:hypothetical protein CEXT_290471 [Caerostris extrusa]|uniref:Endonuclease/exonuclease/phosphatase domain-containing protein n=1 Tax=Caerostris extrusa TaxID=172846 RepID=A0AAV4YE76_CAEEX|nr:hypothetical protein CEXT_290471 [Caerostris extrusa]
MHPFKGCSSYDAICPVKRQVLKLTVGSETEHIRLKNKLVQLGLEFKCFNLKQDRPLKILIRGLPSCTSKEAIGSAINALENPTPKVEKKAQRVPPKNTTTYGKPIPAPQPRTQPPVSNRRFADVTAGRAQNLTPPTEAPLNKSAMEFFKLLLAYIDDESIDFDQLLEAVRLALPSLSTITDHHEKAVTLLRFYNIVRKITINMFPLNSINLHSLRIGYWNANGIRRQLQEVKEFVSDHDLDLFLIQETFLHPGLNPQIPNFTLQKR